MLQRSIAVELVLITLVGAGLVGCFGATLRVRIADRRAPATRRMARPRTLAIRYE